ncbi:hypothetical protein DIPPA_14919 [Diplonema papillatum]|nr:hypothetical protein DIPPA_14919 [Diplonema papillatum]
MPKKKKQILRKAVGRRKKKSLGPPSQHPLAAAALRAVQPNAMGTQQRGELLRWLRGRLKETTAGTTPAGMQAGFESVMCAMTSDQCELKFVVLSTSGLTPLGHVESLCAVAGVKCVCPGDVTALLSQIAGVEGEAPPVTVLGFPQAPPEICALAVAPSWLPPAI